MLRCCGATPSRIDRVFELHNTLVHGLECCAITEERADRLSDLMAQLEASD
ncbi:hypothetical protein [Pseudomonas sp. DWP3-1-2]|uniref:hypothetical protein n=1 Tax=Pseudomonas sp. DWP3-1-2 TaxID=2804645 RepID=UPI003CEC34D1